MNNSRKKTSPRRGGFTIAILCLLTVGLCLLAGCGKKAAAETADEPTPVPETPAPVFSAEDLPGPWRLAERRPDAENSAADFEKLFPGAAEKGSAMELRGDGRMSWHVGEVGATGTWEFRDGSVRVELTDDDDGSVQNLELPLGAVDGAPALTLHERGYSLVWAWGDGEDEAGTA